MPQSPSFSTHSGKESRIPSPHLASKPGHRAGATAHVRVDGTCTRTNLRLFVLAGRQEYRKGMGKSIASVSRGVCLLVLLYSWTLARQIGRSLAMRWDGHVEGQDDPNGHAQLARMFDQESRPISWLWEPLIPKRKVTLLVGAQEMGKSFFAGGGCGRSSGVRSRVVSEPRSSRASNMLLLARLRRSVPTC